MDQRLRTREEILEEIDRKGLSINKLAKSIGCAPSTVAGVLHGKRGTRIGEGHRVAVLLGLKKGEIAELACDLRGKRSQARVIGEHGAFHLGKCS